MREASHTYAEIGLALGKSTTSTYEMAKELAARVQRKLEARATNDSTHLPRPGRRVQHAGTFRIALGRLRHSPERLWRYPHEHGFNISDAANAMLGEPRYTPATLWASIPRFVWVRVPESDFFPWLLDASLGLLATRTSASPPRRRKTPTAWRESWSGFTTTFPSGCTGSMRLRPASTFCASDSLLIDDYGENVERFEAHGGHAVTVPRPWNEHRALDPRRYLEEKLAATLQKSP